MRIRLTEGPDKGREMNMPHARGQNLVDKGQAVNLDEPKPKTAMEQITEAQQAQKSEGDSPQNKMEPDAKTKRKSKRRNARR